uniref:Transmembrane 9 superfamily member n=1 Tax=Chlamydomonas leiostraca TaxID=1034604 RepID=A0A7S0WFB7_9CHLO|mmetsp:Transcript_12281/g.30007  ORF Transcript_12281/g.30007 Transcript_12281/m.30007 type:complete len:590 (+) Transcript_12281:50-1819(+)
MSPWLAVALLGLAYSLGGAEASQKDHKYAEKEAVVLWVNKVGPYNNPTETYNYFSLPYCRRYPDKKPEHAWGGLGEVLEGNELINSHYDIKFRVPVWGMQPICSMALTEAKAQQFHDAIVGQYWYELFMDDLPIWAFVGETIKDKDGNDMAYIYTHKHFDISFNRDRIIHVNLTANHPVLVKPGVNLTFTYAVQWTPTTTPFARRFERYLDYSFFEHKIHWFSIFNSFMMVLFLTGLVAIILMRTLRKDYARYARITEDDMEALERDLAEESGWKMVHGDVFRPPRNLVLLAACVGTGAQLALLALGVVALTIAGSFFEERGTILTAFIVCYALTSCVGGYVSGSFYAANDGRAWIRAMLLTAGLFPGLCFGIAFVLNTIAICYKSLAAVPFGYIMAVILLWSFISFPLCLIGTVIGRNWNSTPNWPCRVKRIPSPVPDRKWYLRPAIITAAGGLLPFGSIFIEMYFIFTSFWNYKVYYVYGFMLLVVCILLIVTACVTIVGTYFLLNAENYHWQWTSFGMAGSTALYVFLYSIHYFVFKTKMTGFFQTCFYFGYTSMLCLGLGLVCGAVGHLAAAAFVRTIYRNVKCD